MNVSKILIGKRIEKSLTQEQVAEKANITRAFYTMIENEQKKPSPIVAQRLANVLGFDWTIFLQSNVTK